MSYIYSINPFSGIICAPFYHIWVLIIVSWICSIIEILWLRSTKVCYDNVMGKIYRSKEIVSNKIRVRSQLESERMSINNQNEDDDLLPHTIINDIEDYPIYKKYIRWLKFRKIMILIITDLYPAIMFIANCINLVIILNYYVKWHKNNQKVSNWNKYCAFIISFMYMPNFKGRSVGRWFNVFVFNDATDFRLYYPFGIVCVFFVLFAIISFPVLFSGIFIFIPSSLLLICIGIVVFVIVKMFHDYCKQPNGWNTGPHGLFGYWDMFWFGGGFIAFCTFFGMWFFVIIILPSMEFFNGTNWVKAYKIGFFAEYCNENDYFQFSQWDQYPLDIKFLILSWMIF